MIKKSNQTQLTSLMAWTLTLVILLTLILAFYPLTLHAQVQSQNTPANLTEEERTWLLNHQKIRVHNERNWGPFNYHEFGRPKGYSIEFMDLLAEKLGLEIEYISGPTWDEFLGLMRNKELDVLLNVIKTEERSKYILFTEPYVHNPTGILVKDDNQSIRDFRDLNGRILAIPKGFFYQEILERHFPGVQLLLLKDQVDSMKAVSFGRAHASIGEVAVQNYLMRKHLMGNLKIVGGIEDSRFANELRIGIRNDWPILRSILQKTMEAITPEEWDRLNRRWLAGGLSQTHSLQLDKEEQEFLAQNPVLRVHNEMSFPPFNFNERGKAKGFSIDIMNLIAQKTGFRVEYISGPAWNDFLAMAKDKQLDVMLNIINTTERRKYLRFTRPYAFNPNVIVSKKSKKYDDIASLEGKTVAVPKGFFYEEVLGREYPELKLHLVDDTLASLKAVSIGKADAALGEAAVFNHLLAQNLINDLTISGEVDIGQPDLANIRMATRMDWPVLQGILDRAIESITREELATISQRWMGNENYIARPSSGLSLTASEKAYLDKQPGITYCANPDWMPIERIGPGGTHEGMVADYLALMADRIGINITMLPTDNSAQSLEFAQSRRCDVMSAAFETPQAGRQLNFTKPYLRLPLVIAIQEDEIFIDGLKSLNGQTIGIAKGYGLLEKFQRDYPRLKVVEVKNIPDGLRQVEEGRIFGLIGAIAPVGHAIRKHRFLNLKIGGRLDEDWKLAVAVRNDSPELLSMFNKATDYITEEEHSKVFQRWVSVKFEHGVNYDLIWKWVIGAALLLSFIALWNWKLSRLNRQLTQEVDLRQQAEQELTQANESLNSKNRELEVLSSTDALTGIANRLHIEKSLDNELSQTTHNQRPLSILLLDIDHFKDVNDTYGHTIGDEVLQGVAQLLRDNTRENDLVGRWGGEEFLIILPETDVSLAVRLAEKLRATLAAEQFPSIDQVTASFGVAEALDDISARHLVQRVDIALYQAKEQGRNRVNTAE